MFVFIPTSHLLSLCHKKTCPVWARAGHRPLISPASLLVVRRPRSLVGPIPPKNLTGFLASLLNPAAPF